jgi:HAAS
MADRDLIDGYLAELSRRLPPDAVEELADGLEETVDDYLRRGLAPAAAVAAAIEEFGRPAQVTAAFARQSAGRRTAFALLATSPAFAVLWGSTLISTKAWTWHIPLAAAISFGVILVAVVATLVTVVRSNNPATTRRAVPAGLGLSMLDLSMLIALVAAAPSPTWTMACAIPASLTRVALTARNLPRLFAP